MTATELNDRLAALAEKSLLLDIATEILTRMRAAQIGFYAAKPGTLERVNALKESKIWEKKADEFLKEQDKPTETKPDTPTLF